jgi:hypothetical protein
MYRGIVPPILVEAPKRAVKFAANSAYQPLFAPKNGGPLTRSGAVAAGVCAGCTEAFLVVPFELVKIRLQARENAGKYKNTLDCVVKILRAEGPVCCFSIFPLLILYLIYYLFNYYTAGFFKRLGIYFVAPRVVERWLLRSNSHCESSLTHSYKRNPKTINQLYCRYLLSEMRRGKRERRGEGE